MILSRHLIKNLVVLVIWRWVRLDSVCVPFRSYYIKGKELEGEV